LTGEHLIFGKSALLIAYATQLVKDARKHLADRSEINFFHNAKYLTSAYKATAKIKADPSLAQLEAARFAVSGLYLYSARSATTGLCPKPARLLYTGLYSLSARFVFPGLFLSSARSLVSGPWAGPARLHVSDL
jgi:hypothetical protein